MDYLVVRKHVDKVLRKGVQERKRKVVVVVLSVYRLLLEVQEHVVHPAHVPLHTESQST
ncbi:hypothetical protein MBAV_000081 [Candidatus Magnetobacterium bavaricum]|uniref:Uncharacterized protein n=1 Tax=Candidatus Magnetobacterium bavaricum TaxID=29290 RepID=A0A0F3H0R3_9BACT|nr:hypothetical protein MBAV_000081 [Candidatus Magnetobacterium bavaricum]